MLLYFVNHSLMRNRQVNHVSNVIPTAVCYKAEVTAVFTRAYLYCIQVWYTCCNYVYMCVPVLPTGIAHVQVFSMFARALLN